MTTARTNMKRLVETLESKAHSQVGVSRAALDFLQEILEGNIDIVEANNPLVYLMEVGAATTAGGVLATVNNTRYAYSSLAKKMTDLYRFMDDKSYDLINALPGTAPIRVSISIESLMEYGVTDLISDSKTLRIPKDTYVTVGGSELTLTKPVVMRRYPNNSIIVYEVNDDGSKNVLNHYLQKNTDELSWLEFVVIGTNHHIRTITTNMTRDTYFSKSIEYVRDFSKIEAYSRINGTWVPIKVSFNKDVQDLEVPTMLVSVDAKEKKIDTSINNHYVDVGGIGEDIKIIVYTTGGDGYDLTQVNVDNKISYRRIDNDTSLTNEEEPMPSANVVFKPLTVIENGRDALTFNELKAAILNNNIGRNEYPVTRGDVAFTADSYGYSIFKAVDILTDRQYIAGRPALSPDGYVTSFTSPLDVCSRRMDISYNVLKDIVGVKKDHSPTWLTIPPMSLVAIDPNNGFLQAMTTSISLKSKSLDYKIESFEEKSLYYTPYAININYEEPHVTVKVYQVTRPVVKSLYIRDRNISLEETMNSFGREVRYEDGHFVLTLITKNTGTLKELTLTEAQDTLATDLSFDGVFIPGTIVDKVEDGLVVEYRIATDLKFQGDKLILLDEDTRSINYPVDLTCDFNLSYSYKSAPVGMQQNSDINAYVDGQANGLTYETLTLDLIQDVYHQWNHTTTIRTGDVYEKHTENIPHVYDKDTYLRNAQGDIEGTEPDCKGTVTKIGSKGDPVVVDGNIVYKYLIGDVVRDSNGAKVLARPTSFTHFLDVMLIDARFLFSNNDNIDSYRIDVEDKLFRDATMNLDKLSGKLLEKTSVNFKPIGTVGPITASKDFSREIVIDSRVDMKIILQVGSSVFKSDSSKDSIRKDTIKTIAEYLKKDMLIRSDLIEDLKEKLGEPVIDVDVSEFMRGNNVLKITDNSYRFSIRKVIKAISLDSYDLVDSIDVEFKNFDAS